MDALRRRTGAGVVLALILGVAASPGVPASAGAQPSVRTTPTPAGRRVEVLPAGGLGPEHAAAVLRKLYPKASIEADRPSNSVIVSGPAADVAEMRRIMRALVAGAPAAPAEAQRIGLTAGPVLRGSLHRHGEVGLGLADHGHLGREL